MAVATKRGRGRPVVFHGKEKNHILSVIRKHGLTKGQEVLAGEKISISLPTMGKFAAEAGIELHRGRPAGEGGETKVKAKPKTKAKSKVKAKAKTKSKVKAKAKKEAKVKPVASEVVDETAVVVDEPAPPVVEEPSAPVEIND